LVFIPAQSAPGVYGRSGFMGYVPVRMYVSTGLIPTYLDFIKTYSSYKETPC